MSDKGQRTEQPTQKKLLKARQKGQFPVSKDFVAGVQFAVFVGMLVTFAPAALASLVALYRYLLHAAFSGELTQVRLMQVAHAVFRDHFSGLVLSGAAVVGVSVATHLLITQFGFASEKLAPDITRLNPLSRLSQMPRQNLTSAVQAAVLLPLLMYAVYVVVSPRMEEFMALPLGSLESGYVHVGRVMHDLLWKAAMAFFVIGCIDLKRQKSRYNSEMRMTKQEVRDEHKESEGSPQMKQRIRRLQRDAARRNMMKQVPNATAIVVNPTHFAVALRYEMDSMVAPTVLAKGKNYLARRIREKAKEHNIPIVENPPLAQALYKSVDVGQEIPAHLYRAVAEILAYIFKLTNGKPPGRR